MHVAITLGMFERIWHSIVRGCQLCNDHMERNFEQFLEKVLAVSLLTLKYEIWWIMCLYFCFMSTKYFPSCYWFFLFKSASYSLYLFSPIFSYSKWFTTAYSIRIFFLLTAYHNSESGDRFREFASPCMYIPRYFVKFSFCVLTSILSLPFTQGYRIRTLM